LQTEDDQLRVIYYQAGESQSLEEAFDLVVLSVGMTPSADNRSLAALFELKPAASGFMQASANAGVFTAGAVAGPMSIADSIASAGHAALQAANYLRRMSRK
jgi:heterodisulfide reductase subunit A